MQGISKKILQSTFSKSSTKGKSIDDYTIFKSISALYLYTIKKKNPKFKGFFLLFYMYFKFDIG